MPKESLTLILGLESLNPHHFFNHFCMEKRFLLPMLVMGSFLLINECSHAQSAIFTKTDGTTITGLLAGAKITFTDDNLVFTTASSSTTFHISDLQKITFDSSSSSINNNSSSPSLSIYPNPATDYIQVSGLSSEGNLVQIYRIDGALMKAQTATSSETTIEITSFAPGIYIVRANGQTLKFVKR